MQPCRILLSFEPATGKVIRQGRLQGTIDKYSASLLAADRKVFVVGQGGQMSVLQAVGDRQVHAMNVLDDEVFATPPISTPTSGGDHGAQYPRREVLIRSWGEVVSESVVRHRRREARVHT